MHEGYTVINVHLDTKCCCGLNIKARILEKAEGWTHCLVDAAHLLDAFAEFLPVTSSEELSDLVTYASCLVIRPWI